MIFYFNKANGSSRNNSGIEFTKKQLSDQDYGVGFHPSQIYQYVIGPLIFFDSDLQKIPP